MDITAVTTLISSVGFPIAMCLLIYINQNKSLEKLTEQLNNNTIALQLLTEKIEKEGK